MESEHKNDGQTAFNKLRTKAELVLNSGNFEDIGLEGKDIKLLFQELQVHQIELEMQNDEMRIANENLELEQMKLIGMYDLAPVGYFVLDRSGIIEEVNNAGMALLNTQGKGTLKGKRLQSFVASEFYDIYYRFFHKIQSANIRQSCQLMFVATNGSVFHAQVEGIGVKALSKCYVAIVDITERIESEQNLSETKERLELALAASAAGTWELDVNTMHFSLDEANCRLCHVKEDQFGNTYQAFIQLVHPEDQLMVDQHFRTALIHDSEVDLVCRFLHDEGQVCFANIRGHIAIKPNDKKGFIGIMVDITDKKHMEEEAAASKQRQQRDITIATLHAEENERKRISDALHDSVSQLLYGIKIQMNELNNTQTPPAIYNRINDLLNVAIQETRNISFELAPAILNDFGLPATIEELTKRLSSSGLKIQHLTVGFNRRFDLLLETSIFRIIQELVNNCMKHSGADLVYIEVRKNKHINIIVKDNDTGFNVKEQERQPRGAGLSSIKNRLSLYNGTMQIDSVPEQGTMVKIKLVV
ncbi:PAS domain-containing protein [Mucilaginibacter robiniae]|uniref:histidine kinase n=1 Tax=Mucilaginibacter robiniae TaxID=2728022 RepID=A0A7L5E0D0_9SPHI|nr:ATP-binding protein [Mucilaginibacter robiniae]QJD96685.1 PAS domain-containing protein [Mucilaginibacter robiniae]